MTVMEHVPGVDLQHVLLLDPSEAPDKTDILRMVHNSVTEVSAILHEHNLVLEGPRTPNVMVAESTRSQEKRGLLVDFDCCGIHEEATYPFKMNQVDIR